MLHDIKHVKVLDEYELLLQFDTGERRRVNVKAIVPFDGVFERLRDREYFRQVSVDHEIGTIVWPNGADLCPDVLFHAGVPVSDAA